MRQLKREIRGKQVTLQNLSMWMVGKQSASKSIVINAKPRIPTKERSSNAHGTGARSKLNQVRAESQRTRSRESTGGINKFEIGGGVWADLQPECREARTNAIAETRKCADSLLCNVKKQNATITQVVLPLKHTIVVTTKAWGWQNPMIHGKELIPRSLALAVQVYQLEGLGPKPTLASYNPKNTEIPIIYRKYITRFLWNKSGPPRYQSSTFPSANLPTCGPSCRLGSKYGYTLKVKAYRSPGWRGRWNFGGCQMSKLWELKNRGVGDGPFLYKWNQVRIDDSPNY